MADLSLEENKLKLLGKLWEYLTAGPNLDSWPSKILWMFFLIIIFILTIAVFIWAVGTLLEGLATALDAYKKSGLPLTFGKEKKTEVRRKQQFCKVLDGDLLMLAKAENWNDQYFTDLEAEVEAEGGYYASLLDKMLRRQSQGLRKVSSLISAIELSTEQCLLVVGQPGSGKSVALRHLAHQFAERGIQSGDPEAIIPLYLNLKELNATLDNGINADTIKQFVLDNIRRGDADTAAYVHQHWDEYRERGIWFFLFDSFDEIPAVLHAPTESSVIRQHAEAIRQFLGGMSNCRGVLASREYKGPNALPWQKIRISSLSEERQEQLIENSFLMPKQKGIVHRHMASNKSSLRNNPLFLTLLCRYVKDHNQPPINDHDLLSEHIDRLARRDEDYVWRKYQLTPDQLIKGAIKIAVLFAENRNLSLAPTQTEIAAELDNHCIPGGDLENMLGALVDVKIGRSDVQEARAGDRRFTFSHRRYQETLFVRHLARTANYLTPRELLTDTRWREYSVTLLQTQDLAIIEPMLIEAGNLIAEYASHSVQAPIMQEFGGHLKYYKWKNDPAIALLSILQEGLERRLDDIPSNLSFQVGQLLSPRWMEGDRYDQMMVLKYGGLLPQSLLSEYIAFAIKHGGDAMENVAFQRVVFLKPIPHTVEDWLRKRLSDEVISARKQTDILRLEALAARLPDTIGVKFVIRRCQLLNKLRYPFISLRNLRYPPLDNILNRLINDKLNNSIFSSTINFSSSRRSKLLNFDLIMDLILELCLFPAIFFSLNIDSIIVKQDTNNTLLIIERTHNLVMNSGHMFLYGCLGLTYFIALAGVISLVNHRYVGERINISYVFKRLHELNWNEFINKGIPRFLKNSFLFAIVFLTPGAIAHGVAVLLGYRHFDIIFYPIAFVVTTFGAGIFITIIEYIDARHFRTRLQIFKNQGLGSSLVLHAQTIEELHYWLRNIDLDVIAVRSLLRLLQSPPSYQADHPIYGSALFKLNWNENSIDKILDALMKNLYFIFLRNSSDSYQNDFNKID